MPFTNQKIARSLTLALVCLTIFASASLAATHALNNPHGMAVDAKGNLYVANSSADNILVFAPSYALQTSQTITQNISLPVAVAFDPIGNLWVANANVSNGGANGSIAEYVDGQQTTNGLITDGIVNPTAMAMDSVGNIWVNNNDGNMTVYARTIISQPQTTRIQTVTRFDLPVLGVAISGDYLMFGDIFGGSAVQVVPLTQALVDNFAGNGAAIELLATPTAFASIPSGGFYFSDSSGNLWLNLKPKSAITTLLTNVPFAPTGLAVDSARKRIYVANGPGNTIAVYSTVTGTLLHTIK